jgi:glycerophosphoryl diester phosphodiesterase
MRLLVLVFLMVANLSKADPFVIAHRGASGERPEHTLAAYRLALEQAADYIEPDLRSTKDGVFIALHDATLNRTTDVALRPEFAERAKLDKKGQKIWMPGDFLLSEIRLLKTKQGTQGRDGQFDGKEGIPTLEEVVNLVRGWNRTHNACVGLMPELRGDADAFIEFVRKHRLTEDNAVPVYLQSFEEGTLRKVREQVGLPAAILMGRSPSIEKLSNFKDSFTAVAVGKDDCLRPESKGWITEAHRLGLKVIAWTFDDGRFDRSRFQSSGDEMRSAFENGVDGVFTDFPATGVAARAAVRGKAR